MHINEIRKLAEQDGTDHLAELEQICSEELLTVDDDNVAAELNLIKAEAIAQDRARRAEALEPADWAFRIAKGAGNFSLMVRADCMKVYGQSVNHSLSYFWRNLVWVRAHIDEWTRELNPTQEQINEALAHVYALTAYGDRMTLKCLQA